MFPHRLGPMDERLHAAPFQVLAQAVALRRSDHVVLEDVPLSRLVVVRQGQARDASEAATVTLGDPAAVLDPCRKMSQLAIEYGGLDVVQESGVAMIVILARLPILTVVAQQARHTRHGFVIRRERATVAE